MISSRNPELFAARFQARVDLNGPIPPGLTTPCHLWLGGKNKGGYGQVKIDGVQVGAHVAAWVRAGNAVPTGHQVLHKCDTRPCVQLDHLFTGTPLDNMTDKVRKCRQSRVGPRNPARGGRNGNATLSEEDALAIRVAYDEGLGGITQRALALKYGVTQSQISKIVLLRSQV